MKQPTRITANDLMIGLAILGNLAAIALPAYQHYTIRSQVSEGLNLAGAAKLAVAETYDSKGGMPSQGNISYGLPQPLSIAGNYGQSVTAAPNSGVITILYKADVGGNPPASNKNIILTPDTSSIGAMG